MLILSVLMTTFVQAQQRQQQEGQIRNEDWNVQGNVIVITYDLFGSPGEYIIKLAFKEEGNPSFNVTPKSVTGDIGDNVRPGTGKRIVWNYRQDIPGGLNPQGLYYVEFSPPVRVQPAPVVQTPKEEPSGGFPWTLTILGLAAVGAGVYFLTQGGEEGGGGGGGSTSLPQPPGRPPTP
ncbi:MAG TPA: hypothetical protein VNN76_10510 [Bacteroidota bacterium]|nr:hypothetical protein [Bacteroidota bacterium]